MESKGKILIVEDEKSIARFLQIDLEKEGFDVTIEKNGRRGYEKIVQEIYDVVLLDIMLPEMDGLEICRRVREVSDVPIIMLTALDQIKDKVEGLGSGADDYMVKPIATAELLARIQVILRRRREEPRPDEKRLVIGNVIIYPERYEVRVNNKPIKLTHKEFELLQYLVENKPNVLSRDQILQKVWGYDFLGNTNVVDVYISYLRAKIDDKNNEKHIHTVRSVGYKCLD